jgi:RhtB (resistance to homoserine/threonine) family protein
MSYLLPLAAIAAAHLLAAISPGPAFVHVTRAAAGQSRQAGLCAALGVAAGAMMWAAALLLGLDIVLKQVPWLYTALQIAGGLYLVWLGVQAWRHADVPLEGADAAEASLAAPVQAFRLGFLVNATNPKVLVFFGSILVALLSPEMPGWVRLTALLVMTVDETLWYVLVALVFSSGPARVGYRRAKGALDRVLGTVLVGFGLRLVWGVRGLVT